FLRTFFDALASRYFIHFASKTRSSLAGLIYKKIFSLNISSQSNVDSGRLISLISADIYQMSQTIPQVFQAFITPLQIIVPFIFVCYYWGVCSLIFFGVMIVVLSFQMVFSIFFMKAIKNYLNHNDERNRITNETILGMRAVKMSGLEKIFIDRIEQAREKQVQDIFAKAFWIQVMKNN
ncbi:MAG: hypothetical protein EZS28_051590, partial [Streblomastix strix]